MRILRTGTSHSLKGSKKMKGPRADRKMIKSEPLDVLLFLKIKNFSESRISINHMQKILAAL